MDPTVLMDSTSILEHLQCSQFARTGGGLGPGLGLQRAIEDWAVYGLRKPGQAQRQILHGLADVIDDVNNEKKNRKKIFKNTKNVISPLFAAQCPHHCGTTHV